MKTLRNIQATVKNGKITITADIVEQEFRQAVQQTTIGFHPKDNLHWIRHAQISQEAFFLKRLGFGVAVPIEEFHDQVALKIEPRLTFAPKQRPSADPLTVNFCSELEPQLQWEVANEPNGEWQALKGANSNKLDPKLVPAGYWVRCKASSDAGWTTTPPMKVN